MSSQLSRRRAQKQQQGIGNSVRADGGARSIIGGGGFVPWVEALRGDTATGVEANERGDGDRRFGLFPPQSLTL